MPDVTEELSKQRIRAKAELRKKNLFLPERPEYDTPVLPLDVTGLDDRRLMRYLVKFTRYQDHIAGELALVEIEETSASALLEMAKAKHLAKGWTGASSERVAIAKAEATLDEGVQQAELRFIQLKSKRKLYNVMLESMARDAALLSREVTRRTSNAGFENRVSRGAP
jgi:hypothetical protein